jgi:murein DD-endopeptidase MepM/ murein hydrolase activator NlpD
LAGFGGRVARAAATEPQFSYPMGLAGKPMGYGFYVRTAYVAENVRYYPGLWHTGENWFVQGDRTAGLPVFAAGAGEVAFADYDYPGRVVIVRHAADLFSMYGHLDDDLAVEVGQKVARGDRIGAVLARSDDINRSHLHFEMRNFLTKDEVNGAAPLYGFTCGYECPPGPGYWPMNAPDHPSQVGWRNSTHLIGHRVHGGDKPSPGAMAMVNADAERSAAIWSAPPGASGRMQTQELPLTAGDRLPLLAISAGKEGALGHSAEAYRLWYELGLPNGKIGWAQAALPWTLETGSDGRASAIRFNFVPAAPLASA